MFRGHGILKMRFNHWDVLPLAFWELFEFNQLYLREIDDHKKKTNYLLILFSNFV